MIAFWRRDDDAYVGRHRRTWRDRLKLPKRESMLPVDVLARWQADFEARIAVMAAEQEARRKALKESTQELPWYVAETDSEVGAYRHRSGTHSYELLRPRVLEAKLHLDRRAARAKVRR